MALLGRIFHQGCERETTLGGATIGLFAGAVAGAVLIGLMLGVLALVEGPAGASAAGVVSAAGVMIVVTVYGFFLWLVGLIVIGAPGWWLLHSLGARCQQAAMIYGGVVMLIISLWLLGGVGYSAADSGGPLVANGRLTAHGWIEQMKTTVPLTLIGAAVGWVIAKIAYHGTASAPVEALD